MFSGIVEATAQLIKKENFSDIQRIWVARPFEFQDLHIGDSIAINGVCLTIEAFDKDQIQFSLGEETLRITGWGEKMPRVLNLERSLKLSDRIHGHLVTGHVDTVVPVVEAHKKDEVLELAIELPEEYLGHVWKKGSLCLNGVSLTINEIQGGRLEFYLIPETLKKTTFGEIQVGDPINIETDYLAKAWLRQKELGL